MHVASKHGSIRALLGRISLRTNVALILLAVVAIFVADRCQELIRIRGEQVERAIHETSEMARDGAARQNDVIADAKAMLRLAADLPVAAADAGSACHAPFRKVVADLPWLRALWIIGADGRAICPNSDTTTAANSADRPYFMNAVASRDFVLSDYFVGRVTGKPSIVAAMPRLAYGRVETVVAAAIELDWLSRIAGDIGASRGADVLLLDSSATVIAAYPQPKEWVGHSLKDNTAFTRILSTPYGTDDSEAFDGRRRIISHYHLPDTHAVLAVMMPLDTVIAKADRLARYEIGKIILAGGLALLVIWIGGDRLVLRPIRNLSAKAILLGGGALDTHIHTDGLSPELKRLGTSFNEMAARLRSREAELRQANEQLAELASMDALTAIANRRGFDNHLAVEWERARRAADELALLAIDVDYFKRFNDCYGHAEGDACLRRIAGVMDAIACRPGDFAARIGGEEFALILPSTGLGVASAVAEALRREIQNLDVAHKRSPEGAVTVSIGVTTVQPGEGGSMSGFLDLADAALYRAKRSGRNRVEVHSEALSLAS